LRSGTAEVYHTEIPGGQYSNLRPQARGLGLEHRFEEVKANYAKADDMLGRLVKVTPSSKVVGDLALFMTSNDLTEEQMLDPKNTLSWPDSIRQLMRGDLGQAMGGFPKKLQKAVLQGEKPYRGRPNSKLAKIDFEKEAKAFAKTYPSIGSIVGDPSKSTDLLSSLLYPKVFKDYQAFRETYSNVSPIPTPAFFYGLEPNEEIEVELEKGKTINVKYLSRTVPSASGEVLVLFKLNGQTRTEVAMDLNANITVVRNRTAQGEGQIGAPLQGAVSRVMVKVGEKVEAGAPLFVLEAMKMESTVTAPTDGVVKEVVLGPKSLVAAGDLVVVIG